MKPKDYLVKASPQEGFDLDEDILLERQEDLIENFDRAKEFKKIKGESLYRLKVEGDINYFMVSEQKDQITFLICFRKPFILNIATGMQVTLWKHTELCKVHASDVFFELLKTHKVIVTDKRQTTSGRLFWERLVVFALQKNRRVYHCDLRVPKQTSMREVTLTDELDELYKNTWGKTREFRKVFLMISETKLAFQYVKRLK
jgi:hypothetical protein